MSKSTGILRGWIIKLPSKKQLMESFYLFWTHGYSWHRHSIYVHLSHVTTVAIHVHHIVGCRVPWMTELLLWKRTREHKIDLSKGTLDLYSLSLFVCILCVYSSSVKCQHFITTNILFTFNQKTLRNLSILLFRCIKFLPGDLF